MKVSKSSWRFAVATTGGMFLIATGVHALSRPGELADYVADGVGEIISQLGDESKAVSSVNK